MLEWCAAPTEFIQLLRSESWPIAFELQVMFFAVIRHLPGERTSQSDHRLPTAFV